MGLFDWFSRAKSVGEEASKVAGGIGDAVGTIITRAKDTVPPEMRGEIELLATEIQGAIEQQAPLIKERVDKMVYDSFEAARQFALEYEGRADQVKPWIQTLRAVIRPVFTIFEMVVFAVFLVLDIVSILQGGEILLLSALPQAYWWQFGIVLTFWFGGRAVEHVVERVQGGTN